LKQIDKSKIKNLTGNWHNYPRRKKIQKSPKKGCCYCVKNWSFRESETCLWEGYEKKSKWILVESVKEGKWRSEKTLIMVRKKRRENRTQMETVKWKSLGFVLSVVIWKI
jgi:hypothetical protein